MPRTINSRKILQNTINTCEDNPQYGKKESKDSPTLHVDTSMVVKDTYTRQSKE